MKNSAQLIHSLNKPLENSRLTNSIKLCNDETNTRARIIHPFLEEPFFKAILTQPLMSLMSFLDHIVLEMIWN